MGNPVTTLHEYIAHGELAGVVALVWRPGQPIRSIAIGRRDVDRDLLATRDTIFRIASLTKPITSVAALTLLDEGRFELDEPITRVAPEFGNVRVPDEWIARLATLPLIDQPGAAFHYGASIAEPHSQASTQRAN
jgi:CubicO group peptidase (beta-lactamase class C family)